MYIYIYTYNYIYTHTYVYDYIYIQNRIPNVYCLQYLYVITIGYQPVIPVNLINLVSPFLDRWLFNPAISHCLAFLTIKHGPLNDN